MILKEKKILFLGDSITEGVGTTSPEHRYVDLFAAKTGAVCLNYGVSGTRIARQHVPTEGKPKYDEDFNMRAKMMEPDADAVVVFGGTNDFGHGDAVFGTTDDRTEDSFCGAVRCLCEYLLEKYPAAKLVFITPLHRWNEADPCGDKKPQPVGTLKEYVQALRAILEEYSIPVLDLYATSGIQPSVSAIKARYMPDGLHPSDLGNELICDRLIHFMELL